MMCEVIINSVDESCWENLRTFWWVNSAAGHWTQPPCCAVFGFCSVVVETLARLLKVAVAFLSCGEPRLCQILPVEGAATQLLSFSLDPGSLDGQQVDVARQGNSPSSEAPGQAQFNFHRPGQVQKGGVSNMMGYRIYGYMTLNC